MTINEESLVNRIDELLALAPGSANEQPGTIANQLVQGALSILVQLYGPNAPQIEALRRTVETHKPTREHGAHSAMMDLWRAVRGVLLGIKGDVKAGLVASLRQQITGDVLSDFVKLSRTALDQNTGDNAKNVAAVLAAAAFEDTIRRMGEKLVGLTGQEDLTEVLAQLKTAGIIQSPQIGIAQSYLSFRNHALHANWEKIEREAVLSVLAFVEQLLLKHFQ